MQKKVEYNDLLAAVDELTSRKRRAMLRFALEAIALGLDREQVMKRLVNKYRQLTDQPDFVIESNIPIEENRSSGKSNLRKCMAKMKVGDSMVLDTVYYNQIATTSRMEKFEIVRRKINNEEFRIWRVK